MKIIFFEIRDAEQEYLKLSLPGHELIFHKNKLSLDTAPLAQDAETISVFVGSLVNKEVIELLPNAKLVTTRATGFDNIDIECAKSKGILVSNVPGYGAVTVAEFTFALLLNLSRKVCEAREQMKSSASYNVSGLRGFDLWGKTIGVIGTGRIGKNVIRIAKGFGMNIVAMDAYPDQNFAKEMDFEYKELNELLVSADIMTIHAPYNKSTHHLLNGDNMPLMKRGVYLVNTARGEIVDTAELVKYLKSGHIAGAGLDVLEGERVLKEEADLLSRNNLGVDDFKILAEDHMLLGMPNVIITPHIAFYTYEAEKEIVDITVRNILKYIDGQPQNIVS